MSLRIADGPGVDPVEPEVDRERAVSLAARLRETASERTPDAGLDLLFSEVDDMLCAGALAEVDRFLAEDLLGLPTVHLVGVLTITNPAKDKLQNRATFVARAVAEIKRREPARAGAILAGLV